MTTLEIHCSKPELLLHGPPAEAADHLCPTPGSRRGRPRRRPPARRHPDQRRLRSAAVRDPRRAQVWLADNGVYTPTGEPADAQTAEADRQYAIFLQAAGERRPRAASLDLDAPEPDVEPAATVEEEEDAEIEGREVFDDDPWHILGRAPIPGPRRRETGSLAPHRRGRRRSWSTRSRSKPWPKPP